MNGFGLGPLGHVDAAGRCLVVLLAVELFLSIVFLILMEHYSNSSTYSVLYRSL